MKHWLFFLLPFSVFATVNEPCRIEWLTGYRNDRIHWHLQDSGDSGALTYSERYTDIEFWENDLSLWGIHRDIVYSIDGSFSAFGKGNLQQRFANLSYTPEQPHLHFNTDGWAADGDAFLGYAVNLTADRTYKVLLVPMLGFSGHYEQSLRKGSESVRSGNAVGASSYELTTHFPGHLHQTWYGVYLGGGFRIEPGGRLSFDCAYAYHWAHLKFSSPWQETVSLYDGSTLLSETTTRYKVSSQEGGNLGQSGWADLEYQLDRAWRLGLAAQVRYFSSQVLSVNEKLTVGENTTSLPQKLKVRWTSISFFATISRKF